MSDTKLPPGLTAQLITLLEPLEARPSPMEGYIQIKWRGQIYHLGKRELFSKDSVDVTAIWTRSDGYVVQILAEIAGDFRLIREELVKRPFSTIIRSAGFKRSPIEKRSA